MRILLHHFTILGKLGGVDKVVQDLALGLQEQGHETGIVEMGTFGTHRRVFSGRILVWTVAKPSIFRWYKPRSWASNARSALQLKRVIREFQPDIINVHFPCSQISVLKWLTPFRHNWRLVATVHNSDIRCLPKSDLRAMAEISHFYEKVDGFTAVDKDLLEEATTLFPCLRSKCRLTPNGVSDEWFHQNPQLSGHGEAALFVGRLEHVKGVDIALEAWSRVHQQLHWKFLLLAGDGAERSNYQKRVTELGLSQSVRFLGMKTHTELRRLYRDAGIVLLPSRREGLPLSLLEAGACGAICLASDIPGNRDIIEHGRTGFLFEPNSPTALAQAILAANRLDAQSREAMREAARSRILSYYSEKAMLASYVKCFQNVAASFRR